MKSAAFLAALAALSSSVDARGMIFGYITVMTLTPVRRDPSPGNAGQRLVWLNDGDGLEEQRDVKSFGPDDKGVNGGNLYCRETCPHAYRVGQCEGEILESTNDALIVSLRGPSMNIGRLRCGADTSYTRGSLSGNPSAQVQSTFRCDLGSAVC